MHCYNISSSNVSIVFVCRLLTDLTDGIYREKGERWLMSQKSRGSDREGIMKEGTDYAGNHKEWGNFEMTDKE